MKSWLLNMKRFLHWILSTTYHNVPFSSDQPIERKRDLDTVRASTQRVPSRRYRVHLQLVLAGEAFDWSLHPNRSLHEWRRG